MLRNVAIPMMLAVTEAEAQQSIEDGMMADRSKPFDGLVANEAACTPETNTSLGTLATTVSDKDVTLTAKKADVSAL